jgi:hypothetical protein
MTLPKKISLDNLPIETKLNFGEIFHGSKIDLSKRPERPPLAISIGYDDKEYNGIYYPLRFGTFGNISLIKGEEKARKSFLKSLIMACSIGGNAQNYGSEIHGHGLKDKYIIDIDTEQDEYDSWLNGARIPNMCGSVPDNYLYISLREYSSKDIAGCLEWLFMESEYRNKLGITCIDGFVDCVEDFNSLVECKEFTKKLMKYSTVTKSHITGLLHLNPASDKARGHLGTILQQKCETVVVIKDMGDYSEVKCQRSRGKKFKTFGISVDDKWNPYVIDEHELITQEKY